MIKFLSRISSICLTGLFLFNSAPSYAGLFEDDEARKAILEIRLENRQKTEELKTYNARNDVEIDKVKKNMLDQANSLEGLRSEIATLRGEKDSLTKDLSDMQRKIKDLTQAFEMRFAKLEPVKVTVDGREFMAEQSEKRDFEVALDLFKKGDFPASSLAFNDFLRRYTQTGYKLTALFWLGNSQYATKEYKDAIANFKLLLSIDSSSPRAPEAMLSVSNCQLDMKDTKSAKKTWEDIIKIYPDSEAANAAKERLARFK